VATGMKRGPEVLGRLEDIYRILQTRGIDSDAISVPASGWREILDDEDAPSLLVLLRRSGSRVAEATRHLAHTLAEGLSSEGASRRHIGRLLAVSHQRVSTILHGRDAPR